MQFYFSKMQEQQKITNSGRIAAAQGSHLSCNRSFAFSTQSRSASLPFSASVQASVHLGRTKRLRRSSARPPHLLVRHGSAPGHTVLHPLHRGLCLLVTGSGGSSSARGLLPLMFPPLVPVFLPSPKEALMHLCLGHCHGLVLADSDHLINSNQNKEDWGTDGERQKHS